MSQSRHTPPSRASASTAPPPPDESGSFLAHILLAVVLVELAIHRLAVPALLPHRDAPPDWHVLLARVGTFFFYFAVVFSFAVLAREVVRLILGRTPNHRGVANALAITASALVALCIVVLLSDGSDSLTFALDTAFTVALLAIVAAQVPRGGDLGARIGTILLALPLILHFYAPFTLRFISGDDLGLPDRMQVFGQWTIVFAALATPYCFAPRPFTTSAARIPPLVVAMFVTILSAVVVRRAAEVGMDLARDGLGLALDPLAPVSMLALYIMALAAVTWTLVACLAAPAPSRRLIGVGIGLVLLGGYAFEWPLQYLLGALGLILITSASRRVPSEERATPTAVPVRRGGEISDEAWSRFVGALSKAISAERASGANPSLLTVAGEGGRARTHLVWSEATLRVRLSVTRVGQRVEELDYLAGEEADHGAAPGWSLWTRPGEAAKSAHPEPPPSPGAAVRSGDESFDARFQMRDAASYADLVLPDAAMRDRTGDLLAGWIALWPGRCLRHRLIAPLSDRVNHPISATDVESDAEAALGPILEVLALLGAMAASGVDL